MASKKVVVKLNMHDEGDKQKAIKAVSSLPGIDSISVDMKESKMTVIGGADPISITKKLRKVWQADIVTVGPAKEEKKDGKSSDNKNPNPNPNEQFVQLLNAYRAYPTYSHAPYYYPIQSCDENPNSCVII